MNGEVVSLHAGLPRLMEEWAGSGAERAVRSGYVKAAVAGALWVGKEHVAGDDQGDLVHHGGPDRVVLAYPAEHYPLWERELGFRPPYGGFAENVTVAGLTEQDVCIGDVFRVGDALLQVSETRIPCWKIARRWDVADLLDRVLATGRTGFFLRTLREGEVRIGQTLQLVERSYPDLSAAVVHKAYLGMTDAGVSAERLYACRALSQRQRRRFAPAKDGGSDATAP